MWDDGSWAGLPVLQGEVRADVCVVGLGGSGLAAVHEALERGCRVVGVDAGSVAGGAAGRNGGFLLAGLAAFHHDAVAALGRERALDLYRLSLAELRRILERDSEATRRTGSLRIATSEAEREDCERQLRAMERDGLPALAYEGPEGMGLLFPEDGVMNPMVRCRRLAAEALRKGARLFERSPVLELGGSSVRSAQGAVSCDGVVVAVDGGLERLLPELAGRVRTARLQMLATEPTDELRVPRPVYLRYGFEYYQQTPDGRVALGGFRDRGGEAEWTYDSDPSEPVQAMLEGFLREHLGVRAGVAHRWAASVGFTPGVLPVFTEPRPGVVAIGGYNGTGNVIGSILGRAAAQRVTSGASDLADAFDAG